MDNEKDGRIEIVVPENSMKEAAESLEAGRHVKCVADTEQLGEVLMRAFNGDLGLVPDEVDPNGAAVIADADGKLAGIFTDGDFRRIVAGKGSGDVLGEPVAAYMTKGPLFVRNDALAAEIVKVFEKKRIDDLPVCDADGRVVGLVDIQDLPKIKVL